MTDMFPSSELVTQWRNDFYGKDFSLAPGEFTFHIANCAAQWGADAELDACCEWFLSEGWNPEHPKKLRSARRLMPSLKEQALGALYAIATGADDIKEFHQDLETIKQALESLSDTSIF